MKKSIVFISAFAALLVAACQLNEIDTVVEQDVIEQNQEQPKGVLMTLNADFASLTKTAYTEENKVLKCEWAAGDSIAVVSFNANSSTATVRSIDKFALKSGDGTSSGVFEGYYSGGDAERIVCFYPPISPYEYDDLDMPKNDGYYGSERINGAKGTKNRRAIYEVKVGTEYIRYDCNNYSYASASGDLTPLSKRNVLFGYASLSEKDPYTSSLDVTLQNLYSVIKLTVVLPASLSASDVFTRISLVSDKNNSFGPKNEWGYAAEPDMVVTTGFSYQDVYLGSIDGSEGTATGINLPADKTIVCYIPTAVSEQPAGTKWTVTAYHINGDEYTKTVTFPNVLTFDPGKMYRLNVNLEGTASPAPPAATNLSPMNQTANCYVVASDDAAAYKFKNCKGTDFNYMNSTAVSAEVLWESPAGALSAPSVGSLITSAALYDDGYVYIETTGARGNAVVAVKDDTDKILWSWHIWCTGASFNPTTDYHDAYNFYMMKVNLGAFSYAYTTGDSNGVGSTETAGLLYQFGRKDPFRGVKNLYADVDPVQMYTTNSSNWNYVECTAETGTVAYAHAHPMTYIQPNRNGGWGNMDWVYTEGEELQARDRWTSSNDDPCPYGWRVMNTYDNISTWDHLDYVLNTDKYAGVNFILPDDFYHDTVDSYFPYAGYIDEDGHGIVQQYYDPRGYGLENYFRYSGFYWTTSGGTTKYRKFMLIQDRKGYDDPSTMNEVNDNLAPVVTIKTTYNYDNMYTWGPQVGCGNAMSVRCIKANN